MLTRFITDSRGALLFMLLIALCLLLSDSATPRLIVPNDAQCACVGMELTYTCTAVGGGSTLWTGTAFDCSNNWINLRHSLFNDPNRGATGDCSGGALMGQSLGVMGNCYTSQLHVRVAADMNNETINCDHRPGTEINTIGESTLIVMTAPLPPPNDVRPALLLGGNLTFQWSSVAPACSNNLEYRINYSVNCGNCVLSSNTSATCYGVPQPMATCNFSVQSVVCGNQIGDLSRPVELMLKVPDIPHVNVFPVYSNDGRISAIMVMIINNQTIHPYSGFSVPVSSYTVSFNNSTPSVMLSSVIISPCVRNVCKYRLAASTYCQTTGSIGIAVSAKNELGAGLSSDPEYIECSNNLMNVMYDGESSTITCTFYDPQNVTGKSCVIDYRICNSQLMGQSLEASSTPESPNIVTLNLQSIEPDEIYCYNVTASGVSYTVIVVGMIGMARDKTVNTGVIIAAVVFPVAFIILVLIFTVTMVLIYARYSHKKEADDKNNGGALLQPQVRKRTHSARRRTPIIEEKLNLHKVPDGCFKKYVVENDCQIKSFLKDIGLKYWRGCTYYEFHYDLQPNIGKDKQLLFMKEDESIYSSNLDSSALEGLGCVGEYVTPPEGYRLFVQTTGSGTRHLPQGSLLLYDIQKEDSLLTTERTLPRRLLSNWFILREVCEDCTLKQFQIEHSIDRSKHSIFLECDITHGDCDILDIILVKKGTERQQPTPELFTWPSIRCALQEASQDLEEQLKDWRILVMKKDPFIGTFQLKKGSIILCERPNPQLDKEQFRVLEVKKSNMRMSSFIKQKLGSFENGCAFYEFTDKEDFLHYKEVVKVLKSQLNIKDIDRLSLQPDISLFYTINGAPGKGLIPKKLNHVRVFVQSTSFGSRCLKAGETILYKMDNEQQHKEFETQV